MDYHTAQRARSLQMMGDATTPDAATPATPMQTLFDFSTPYPYLALTLVYALYEVLSPPIRQELLVRKLTKRRRARRRRGIVYPMRKRPFMKPEDFE